MSELLTGGEMAYDGPNWHMRSPIFSAENVKVPAFISGVLHDIFQRGSDWC
ncbi:hypothetical protein [Neobacillus terrae]|uniref:hypothetical protein n=1 Tax=Neobacillus terrae TaxID=3034837 RepID=UPI00140D526C|nr:hypothetical protein [Neobacillus terrae]NHM32490.1 hypothetical protein [Neobacillus terrae]